METSKPVSIHVVTYLGSEERGGILRETCKSALAQRYPDFEVVVSDNGGAFSAAEALKDLKDDRLKIRTNATNAGFTGNINRCLEHCSHDIIKLMCDDDLIHPDFLAQTVPLVDDGTLVVVDVEKYLIGQPPESIGVQLFEQSPFTARAPGYDRGLWTIPCKSSSIPSATIFTRALFERLGGFDAATITSDMDFFMEACLHGRLIHVRKTLCYVGVWGGSLTEEMVSRPYFFPHEALYTKFRVYHCKGLGFADRMRLLGMLFREAFVQGLRVFKNFRNPLYRMGYRNYLARFFDLLRRPAREFGDRPCNP